MICSFTNEVILSSLQSNNGYIQDPTGDFRLYTYRHSGAYNTSSDRKQKKSDHELNIGQTKVMIVDWQNNNRPETKKIDCCELFSDLYTYYIRAST